MFNQAVILVGEIRDQSPLGPKGLLMPLSFSPFSNNQSASPHFCMSLPLLLKMVLPFGTTQTFCAS